MNRIARNGVRSLTKIKRATHVREVLAAMVNKHGDWSERPRIGTTPPTMIGMLHGSGWQAMLSSRLPNDEELDALAENEEAIVFFGSSNTLDFWLDGFGKVLSIAGSDDDLELVSMVPGPWERSFGLPDRDWPRYVIDRAREPLPGTVLLVT